MKWSSVGILRMYVEAALFVTSNAMLTCILSLRSFVLQLHDGITTPMPTMMACLIQGLITGEFGDKPLEFVEQLMHGLDPVSMGQPEEARGRKSAHDQVGCRPVAAAIVVYSYVYRIRHS
jgi:hypothetical protein